MQSATASHRIEYSHLLQSFATAILLIATAALISVTVAGAFGLMPFLTFPLQFGETVISNGGIFVQCGLILLLLVVASALPAGRRVVALERTHRDFSICMSDVAEAYRACHAADRTGAFAMSSEFDAVKERIRFLRDHPDLGHLEPDILEAAAQMSQASHELAVIYSDRNVDRARDFLAHRQEECDLFASRIDEALAVCRELSRHLETVEMEEDVMQSRLAQLEAEYGETLRSLGFTRRPDNVVSMSPKVAAE